MSDLFGNHIVGFSRTGSFYSGIRANYFLKTVWGALTIHVYITVKPNLHTKLTCSPQDSNFCHPLQNWRMKMKKISELRKFYSILTNGH